MCENENASINGACNLFPECTDCQKDTSCFRKIAGVLSDVEIKQLELIPYAKNDSFNPTVYDLSLGSFHYVYGMPRSNEPKDKGASKTWIPVCIGSDNEFNKQNKSLSDEEKFVRQNKNRTSYLTIPALGSALIQLDEIIDTYSVAEKRNVLVTGRFDLKLTLVNKGLISQQGTQVEPCYRGRLYCFVHNLSNKEIVLKQGDTIASIEFSYVSCFCNEDKRKEVIRSLIKKNKDEKRYLKAEYCDEGKGILNVRYFNRKKYLPDSCGLSHISESAIAAVKEPIVIDDITAKVKSKIDKKMTIITALIASITSIIVALIGGYFTAIKPMIDETKELQSQVQSYEGRIELYESTLVELEDQLKSIIDNSLGLDGVEVG